MAELDLQPVEEQKPLDLQPVDQPLDLQPFNSVKALAYGPIIGEHTRATTEGPLGALGPRDVALSPNLLAENGGPYQIGGVVHATDSKGNYLGPFRVADYSYYSPGKPTTDTVEF